MNVYKIEIHGSTQFEYFNFRVCVKTRTSLQITVVGGKGKRILIHNCLQKSRLQ